MMNMFFSITNTETIYIVESILALTFLVIGLSHILQKQMWADFFTTLAKKKHEGVIWRCFVFELWPSVMIVIFHQDWSFPGIIITLYGHLLLLKISISLLFPQAGLKSLKQAESLGSNAFLYAGLILIVLGVLCLWRIITGI